MRYQRYFCETFFTYSDDIEDDQCMNQHNFILNFSWFLTQASSNKITQRISMFLFFAADPFISFKTTILYFIGRCIIIVLKLVYVAPRPFWLNRNIRTYQYTCKFNFAHPSVTTYNLTFFYGYSIFMYFI